MITSIKDKGGRCRTHGYLLIFWRRLMIPLKSETCRSWCRSRLIRCTSICRPSEFSLHLCISSHVLENSIPECIVYMLDVNTLGNIDTDPVQMNDHSVTSSITSVYKTLWHYSDLLLSYCIEKLIFYHPK